MNKKKVDNVIKLSSKDRYGYLIRKVADFEKIFLICDSFGGLVTIGDSNSKCIPVWPEKEFAELFLTNDWKNYKVKSFSLDKFLTWLDKPTSEKYEIAGFPNLDLNAVVVTMDEIKNHLIYESSQYE